MSAAYANGSALHATASAAAASKGYFKETLALLMFLNVLDATATAFWVCTGRACEANPLMAALFDLGVAPFVLGKLLMVSGAAVVLWTHRDRALSQLGVRALVIAYAMVAYIHLAELHRMVA